MYSSLLNFAQLTDTNVTTISETSGIFLIKTLVAIALFFPLLALAVVLIMRVGMLWLYIAASPFIVITKVFDKIIPADIAKQLDITNVFKLIFAPVVTVAALSISLIFMTALISGFKSGDNQHISSAVSQNLQIQSIPAQPGNQAFQMGSTSLEFKNFDRGWNLDRLSRLIVNFFAIWLLWTIVFAAIKANSLGEKIGGGIQDFGGKFFSTLPVLPIGQWGERVWVGSAFNVGRNVVSNMIPEKLWQLETNQEKKLEKIFNMGETPSMGGRTTITAEQAQNIFVPGATTAWITTAIENLWVEKTKVPEYITSNNSIIYGPISKMAEGTEKENLKTAIGTASGNLNWYVDVSKEESKKTFTTIISDKIIQGTDVKKLLTDNKVAADLYFKNNDNKPFEKTLDDGKTKITITPAIDPKDASRIIDYTVTETK